MVNALSSTLQRAKELAHKRRQPASTAHVLVALFQADADVRAVCVGSGASEAALLGALAHIYDERPNAIDLAAERARKLSAALGELEPPALSLLLALSREARCAASGLLTGIGVQPELVSQACLARLEPAPAAEYRPARQLELAERIQSGGGRRTPSEPPRAVEPEALAAVSGSEDAAGELDPPRLLHRHKRIQEGKRRALLAAETESKLSRRAPEPGRPADGNELQAGEVEVRMPRRPLAADSDAPELDAKPKWPRRATAPDAEPLEADGRAARRANGAAEPARSKRAAPDEDWSLDAERFPLLAGLGLNLTALAASGRLDPVVGRDADVQRVQDVLARRRANNPVLVGAPGVGKTAIAHGLAHAFVHAVRAEAAPTRLLIELSASSLLSGTGVRGALSERVQRLRAEVADAAGRVLLFVDEVHGLLGGGEADSLANELKTALAQGELPLMGATTDAEYRRVFERDPALARRFTRVEIAEPSPEAALEMLQRIVPHYAEHHGVRYERSALEAAVAMSVRYLPLRQLPDKAIALMDQAGARAQRSGARQVDAASVAAVVSELVGVPCERLLMQDGQALLALEEELGRRVVGQSAAIGCIANALRKSAAGFRGARPLGTFLFTGPTGVGKTEMARAISDVLFPGIAWTRIDMSELGQAHGLARLLGAPPGYLGHDEGGQLTEAVRSRPYQLILLDEIEKAHLEVLLALLPLLDEGRLTDGRGRTVDFTNTVIVMTSNLGAECAVARGRIGFEGSEAPDADKLRDQALAAVRAALPPELYNRIDEPLYFAPLTRDDVAEIARRMLASLAEVTRSRHDVELEVEPSAIDALIAAGGFDRALGARPMRRTVGRLVEAPLARLVLARELPAGSRVVLRGHAGRIDFATERRNARNAAVHHG